MNVQCYLIRDLMLYEFEQIPTAVEATKNICRAEAKYGIIWKRFLSDQFRFWKKNSIDLNFHDELYYSSTFSLKFKPILASKKRNDKESMICWTPKPNKKFPKWLEFLYGFHQAHTLIIYIYIYIYIYMHVSVCRVRMSGYY